MAQVAAQIALEDEVLLMGGDFLTNVVNLEAAVRRLRQHFPKPPGPPEG